VTEGGTPGPSAVLLSSAAVREFLINYARPFIFSTAMSVLNVLAIECSWDLLQSDEGDEVGLRMMSWQSSPSPHLILHPSVYLLSAATASVH
jgi:8-amino-7-oxononanoate synthase